MKIVYHLPHCQTCKRIITELNLVSKGFTFRDIKSNPITEEELLVMRNLAGSYNRIFSKRSQLYRKYELAKTNMTEDLMKKYILEHYSFLKRPVIIYDMRIAVGSSKSELESLKTKF